MDGNIGRVEMALVKRELKNLLKAESGLDGAMFCTSDGFDLASALPSAIAPATLAAMVSSQFALSDALCREVGFDECHDLVVDAMCGRVLVLEIPATDRGLALAAIANAKSTLGQVLYACRQVADRVGSHLGARIR